MLQIYLGIRKHKVRLKRAFGLMLLILLALSADGGGRIRIPEGAVVIRNGSLIDGSGKQPVKQAVLVIKDDKIWAVGQARDFSLPHKGTVIDAANGFILPGFIDSHAHITYAKSLTPWLTAGITTVRDLGGPLGIVLARRYTAEDEPRLLVAGPILTVPGGYPIPAWGEKAAQTVRGPREAERAVNSLIDQGVDVIKIAVSEGMGDTPWPTLSVAEIKAITAAAHSRGKKVAAHVLRALDARRAVEGGVDQLAHSPIDEMPQDLLLTMARQKVIMIPTLSVLLQGASGAEDLSQAARQGIMENLKLNVSRFAALGGEIALGDDFGVIGVKMAMPLEELELMAETGLTPLQVIAAATGNAAKAVGLEQELGTLESGKTADVLIVKANPLEDLTNLTALQYVIFKGKPFLLAESN